MKTLTCIHYIAYIILAKEDFKSLVKNFELTWLARLTCLPPQKKKQTKKPPKNNNNEKGDTDAHIYMRVHVHTHTHTHTHTHMHTQIDTQR